MIYETCRYTNAEHSFVEGTDALGNVETVSTNFTLFRQPEHGPAGFVAAGGVIAPYEPPPVTLPDLAPWQFRAMLKLSGKENDLIVFLDAMAEPTKTVAKAKLEYTLVFQRENDLVLAAQQAMGLTEQQLDALWTQALSL